MRQLCTGYVGWTAVVSVVYLLALTGVGLVICRRRLDVLLLS